LNEPSGSVPMPRKRRQAEPAPMRIQKRMAHMGVASRRECERLIREGRVTVNGRMVTEMGTTVVPDDAIAVDGQPVNEPEGPTIIVLNKPPGVVCTRADPEGRDTIYDLLDPSLPHLAHVGRLDLQTEGVLLLTNDGDLTQGLLRPENGVPRVYHVKLRGRLNRAAWKRLEEGIPLDGRPTAPLNLERLPTKSRHDWISLTLTEGRNRHVRRLMEAVGHSVTRLRRVSFGGINAEGLPVGRWRNLSSQEHRQLKDWLAR
jgi:23S rRNA pseudouridine2605 synthase